VDRCWRERRSARYFALALVAVTLTVTNLATLSAANAAGPYPPVEPCALSVTAITGSGTFDVIGSGLGQREVVVVSMQVAETRLRLATFHTDGTGAFRGVVDVPDSPAADAATVTARTPSTSCSIAPTPGTGTSGPSGPATNPSTAGTGGVDGQGSGTASDGAGPGTPGERAGGSGGSPSRSGRATPAASGTTDSTPPSSVGTSSTGPSQATHQLRHSGLNLPLATLLSIVAGLIIFGLIGVVVMTRRSGD
jgi:hypothetical protein